jgi:putative sterol carrier protein
MDYIYLTSSATKCKVQKGYKEKKMSFVFPSPEWVNVYKDAINTNKRYHQAAKTWTYGPVALIITKEVEIGIKEDIGIWLDLHEGKCQDAKIVKKEEAMKAPFVIAGTYTRWKQVINKTLEPIKGLMQGKLKLLKGHMPTVVRYVKASQELVESTSKIETKFIDE